MQHEYTVSGHTNEQTISVSSCKDSVYAHKWVPDGGFGHLHPVNMSMGLPLDLVQAGREGAVWADYGRLIYPETDGAWADETCRSHISIDCAHSMRMVSGNLRSFPTATGASTGAGREATAGTGCAANNRLKLGLCFFAMSFRKK